MGHNIQSKDTIHSTNLSWHKLDKVQEKIDYDTSGLNWTVERQKILLESSGNKIDGYFAVHCPEKDETINVAKESYQIIQNSQLFEIIEESLIGIPHKIITAGSIGNLSKVFISVALEEKQDYLINGEAFKNYLSFVSSHNGSLNLEAYDSSVRICCANTLQWSRRDKGLLSLRVRHTKNANLKIENMKQEIDKLFEKREEFYTSYEALMNRPMSSEMAEKILIGFEAVDDLSTRTKNKVQEIHQLYANGAGNDGKTVADLLNGVTEYYSGKSSKTVSKSWSSSEFGSGAKKKLDFWGSLDDNSLNRLAVRGEKLLALSV
jgi:phage/plasmid-like protein (TIGR03299 family)